MVKREMYAGLFMITLTTLMFEILLTRIFSVVMWYHFAFMAISIATFGMTVGAIIVYLMPGYFTVERARYHLALSSWLFSITIVLSYLVFLAISIPMSMTESLKSFLSLASVYLVVSIPFVFSGICVCLALTKFPQKVSKLYAVDLAGAAIGCIFLVLVLSVTHDGPTAVIVTAFLASVGALMFTRGEGFGKLQAAALTSIMVFGLFSAYNTMLAYKESSPIKLTSSKGSHEVPALLETWNSFSRIRVVGDVEQYTKPSGWGMSEAYQSNPRMLVRELYLDIDSSAGTILTAFDGDYSKVEHLKYDVTNIAHYIRPSSKVLVVGVGGGRDILSALVFNQKSVMGVEINEEIIYAMNERFGDFTGHLGDNPKVTLVNDEARSYIARTKDEFDILQVSLVDTAAATAAGAFVLAENTLYTLDAWKLFLERLSPNGVLTFSRWYLGERPIEMYRLTELARAALAESGIAEPREHMLIVRSMGMPSVGNLLVSKEPFSKKDIETIESVVKEMGFVLVLTPDFSVDPNFGKIASGQIQDLLKDVPLNLNAPLDDSPFFFHMLKLRALLSMDAIQLMRDWSADANLEAIFILMALLIIVTVLTVLCIVVPLLLTTRRETLKGASLHLIFFTAIGMGFMLVEISQMQRLIVFLGHPTYGLSVVLFALLLSSGIGSFLTQGIEVSGGHRGRAIWRFYMLLLMLFIFGIITPYAITTFQGTVNPVRILVSIVMLFPIGLFMGMAFPLGLRQAERTNASITPWLWGINGAATVCASVLAVVVSMGSSITTTFWVGTSFYVIAMIVFSLAGAQKEN